MVKKLIASVLSLLICLSLSTNQAKAIDLPESTTTSAQAEISDSENPEKSGDLGIMLSVANVPDKDDDHLLSGGTS